ncbi:hypothetical protein GQ457_03G019340 [Hibiscus cannabinus]
MVDSAGEWDWRILQGRLPQHILLCLAAMHRPQQSFPIDRVGWGLWDDRRFSIKSAYQVRLDHTDRLDTVDPTWKIIHHFRGLQRIKIFLWLVYHKKLMTNDKRTRRHFTPDNKCLVCIDMVEDVDHVLRHCPSAKLVWTVLINPMKRSEFFSLPFEQWFALNLRQQGDFVRELKDWDMLFPAVLWNLWKQRNDRVFNGVTEEWGSVVARSKWFADSSTAAAATLRIQHAAVASNSWCPPEDGWVKLNTDGTRSSIDGRAACGGVLRDHTGTWIRGFTRFVGRCSVVEAELWGIGTGMALAWELGYRQLVIETDSVDALRLIEQRSKGGGPFTLVHRIHVLRVLDWRLVFSKIGRDSNDVADRLAKLASYASLDTEFFDESPL